MAVELLAGVNVYIPVVFGNTTIYRSIPNKELLSMVKEALRKLKMVPRESIGKPIEMKKQTGRSALCCVQVFYERLQFRLSYPGYPCSGSDSSGTDFCTDFLSGPKGFFSTKVLYPVMSFRPFTNPSAKSLIVASSCMESDYDYMPSTTGMTIGRLLVFSKRNRATASVTLFLTKSKLTGCWPRAESSMVFLTMMRACCRSSCDSRR